MVQISDAITNFSFCILLGSSPEQSRICPVISFIFVLARIERPPSFYIWFWSLPGARGRGRIVQGSVKACGKSHAFRLLDLAVGEQVQEVP